MIEGIDVILATLREKKEEVVRWLEAHDAIQSVEHTEIGAGPASEYPHLEIGFIFCFSDDTKIGARLFISLLDPVEDSLKAMEQWCRRTLWRIDACVSLNQMRETVK
jgi:hypothetical protein